MKYNSGIALKPKKRSEFEQVYEIEKLNKNNMDTIINDFSIGLFIWQALILLSIGLWIYCLIDILKNKFTQNDKLIWILVVILIPFIGSLLYLFIGKNKKLKLS